MLALNGLFQAHEQETRMHSYEIGDSRIRLIDDQHDTIFEAIAEAQRLCDEQFDCEAIYCSLNLDVRSSHVFLLVNI